MADQDDIWNEEKISIIRDLFIRNNAQVILHNGVHFNESNELYPIIKLYKSGFVQNLFKSSYWGCCMAFRKNYIDKFMPFTNSSIAHDQLIGLFAEYDSVSFFCNQNLIMHRVHSSNQSTNLRMINKIYFRLRILMDFIKNYKK